MGRLFVLLFLLPWWAYVPASIVVLWVGERVYEQTLETEADKAAALEAPMPEAVDLGVFDPDRDIHAAREVHVVGKIDHDLDYELVERTNGVPTTTRYLYMIFGADEPAGSKVVRAALMLDKREEAAFFDGKADEWAIDATEDYWVYAFNGFATRSTKLGDMVSDAIEEQGLTKAEDFVYIEPFFEGREAALSPRGVPDETRQIGWFIAAAVALIGVVKRVKSVRSRPEQGDEATLDPTGAGEVDPLMDATPAPATSFTVPDGVSQDTPLGRLARRNGGGPAPSVEPQPTYRVHAPLEPDPDYGTEDDPDADIFGAEPAQAVYDDGSASFSDPDESPFPPVMDAAEVPAAPNRSSDASFYAKLVLAMLVVGALAYDPSLLDAALPLAGVLVFWGVLFIGIRRLRRGAKQLVGGGKNAPRHTRRPDGAAQTVAMGAGGQRIDLTAPVQGTAPEHGVI